LSGFAHLFDNSKFSKLASIAIFVLLVF